MEEWLATPEVCLWWLNQHTTFQVSAASVWDWAPTGEKKKKTFIYSTVGTFEEKQTNKQKNNTMR